MDDTPPVKNAPFSMIPESLLHSGASDRAVRLYGVLQRFAGADGRCFPTRRALAEKCGCSIASIDRATAELKSVGLLTVQSRKRPDGSFGASSYVLPAQSQSSPVRVPTSTGEGTSTHQRGGVLSPVTQQEGESVKENQITKETTPQPPKGETAALFALWQTVTGHPGTKLDNDRKRRIDAALRSHGFADCSDAIHGVMLSSWHMGDNPSGRVYDAISVIFKNAEKLEGFRDLYRNGPARGTVKLGDGASIMQRRAQARANGSNVITMQGLTA